MGAVLSVEKPDVLKIYLQSGVNDGPFVRARSYEELF